MQKDKREDYEKFWAAFGRQIKYGAYVEYGAHKELLQDLLMYHSLHGGQAGIARGVRFPHEGRPEVYLLCLRRNHRQDQSAAPWLRKRCPTKGYEVLYG